MKVLVYGLLALGTGLIVLVVLVIALSDPHTPSSGSARTDPATPSLARIPELGAIVYLEMGNLNNVYVAPDLDSENDFLDAAVARDTAGTQRLVLTNRLFVVGRNTRARVIGFQAPGTLHVRVLDDAEPLDGLGRDGWVPQEWATH